MSLQCFDGFDHYNSITDMERRSSFIQYQRPVGGASYSFVTGRNGFGKAFLFESFISGSSHGLIISYGGIRYPDNFIGMACKVDNNVGMRFVFFDSIEGTAQCSVLFNPNNYAVQVYAGEYIPSISESLIAYSLNNVWFGGQWSYFEIWPTIGAGTGKMKVYFNNNLILNASGLNIRTSGNNWWDQLELTGAINGQEITIDDHYVCDTQAGPGLAPNDTPIGDSKVSTLWATGDNSVMWTPLSGASNYAMIDEVAMDSDTSYNYSSVINDTDLFAFQTLPAGVNLVHGIQLTGAWRKDDGGVRTINQRLEIGGTEYAATDDHNIPDVDYAYFVDLWVLNPDTTLNWTIGDVNGLAAGYKLVA